MPITIVSTAGSASANSYITSVEFDAYIATCLHVSAAVSAVTSDNKNRALVSATRLLDEQIEWDGDPNDADVQALQWPRSGLDDDKGAELDEDTIPTRLKNATAELARYLIDADRTVESSTEGIEQLGVGSINIRFSANKPPERKVIPDSVWQMVSLWGEKKYQGSIVSELERA
jgi:hypothetical protein